MTERKRVVVTGMGAVTPLGNTVAEYWDGLVAGRCGIDTITKFDPTGCSCTIAAEIKNLNYEDHFDRKEARKYEDFTKNAIIAAREAGKNSGIFEAGIAPEQIGCLMGVGIGGINYIEEQVGVCKERGPGRVSPLFIPRAIANIAPGLVSIIMNLKGPSLSVVTACAAGTHAIGEAAEMIKRGDALAMFAGGSEAAICQVAVAGFGNMQALATGFNDRPKEASRPFDAQTQRLRHGRRGRDPGA